MRVKDSGFLETFSHQACSLTGCQIECLAIFHVHLSRYLDELSRVFFRKENMRDVPAWWLSGFYSLCIQSIVRRALIIIIGCKTAGDSSSSCLGPQQFLHLAVRL